MYPAMNDTKWDEIRFAMHDLDELSPRWRTLDLKNGYLSDWDGEWFHHFRAGGYKYIEWLEIAVKSEAQAEAVLNALVRIHVPGEITENGFKVLGYVVERGTVNYIESSSKPAHRWSFATSRSLER